MQFYQTTSYVYSISYQIVQIPFCCTETVVAAKSALSSSNSVAMSRGIDKKVPQNPSSVRCRISWSIFMTRINTTAFLLFPTACLCHRTYPYCPLPPLHSYSSTETQYQDVSVSSAKWHWHSDNYCIQEQSRELHTNFIKKRAQKIAR